MNDSIDSETKDLLNSIIHNHHVFLRSIYYFHGIAGLGFSHISKAGFRNNVRNNNITKNLQPPQAKFTSFSQVMTSNTARLDRYKLQSELTDDGVTHCTIQSDLGTGSRRIEVRTTWRQERRLGAGGFGEVFLQRETGSGELRAVKEITRKLVNVREMDALIDLQDVRMTLGI